MPDWQADNTIQMGGAPSSGVWEAFAAGAMPMYKAAIERRQAKEDTASKAALEREQMQEKFQMLMKMQDAKSKSDWDLEQDKQENALWDRAITQGGAYLGPDGKPVAIPMFDKNGNMTAAQRAKQRLEYAKIFSAAGHQDPFGMADNALDDDLLNAPGVPEAEKEAIRKRRAVPAAPGAEKGKGMSLSPEAIQGAVGLGGLGLLNKDAVGGAWKGLMGNQNLKTAAGTPITRESLKNLGSFGKTAAFKGANAQNFGLLARGALGKALPVAGNLGAGYGVGSMIGTGLGMAQDAIAPGLTPFVAHPWAYATNPEYRDNPLQYLSNQGQ